GSARFARAGMGALALLARDWERSLCSCGTGSARFARAGLGALAIARAGLGALALLARVWERSLSLAGGGDGSARSGRAGALARVGAAGGRGLGRSALRAGRALRGEPDHRLEPDFCDARASAGVLRPHGDGGVAAGEEGVDAHDFADAAVLQQNRATSGHVLMDVPNGRHYPKHTQPRGSRHLFGRKDDRIAARSRPLGERPPRRVGGQSSAEARRCSIASRCAFTWGSFSRSASTRRTALITVV